MLFDLCFCFVARLRNCTHNAHIRRTSRRARAPVVKNKTVFACHQSVCFYFLICAAAQGEGMSQKAESSIAASCMSETLARTDSRRVPTLMK